MAVDENDKFLFFPVLPVALRHSLPSAFSHLAVAHVGSAPEGRMWDISVALASLWDMHSVILAIHTFFKLMAIEIF